MLFIGNRSSSTWPADSIPHCVNRVCLWAKDISALKPMTTIAPGPAVVGWPREE